MTSKKMSSYNIGKQVKTRKNNGYKKKEYYYNSQYDYVGGNLVIGFIMVVLCGIGYGLIKLYNYLFV